LAELYERLPTVNDSARQVVEPAPLANTLATDALNFAARAAPVVGEVIESNRRSKAEKKKAEDAAVEDQVLGEVPAILGLRSAYQGDTTAQSAIDESISTAEKITTLTEAHSQGRGVNVEAGRLKSEGSVTELLARYPGHRAVVFKVLKEAGVMTRATQEYDRAESLLTKDEEHQQQTQHAIEDVIVKELGVVDYYQKTPEEQAKLQLDAGSILAQRTKMKMALDQASLVKQNIDINSTAGKEAVAKASKQLLRTGLDSVGPLFDGTFKALEAYVFDPKVPDGEKDKNLSQFILFAQTDLRRQYAQSRALLAENMDPSDLKVLDDQVEMNFKQLENFLTGPASLVQQKKRELDILSSTFEIDASKAFPLWSKLRGMKIGGETLATIMTNQVLTKDLTAKIKKEFDSAAADSFFSPGEERIVFNNLVRILNGEDNVINYGPKEVRAVAPKIMSSVVAMANNPKIVSGEDVDSHYNMMNAISNASAVAVDANVQWGFGTNLKLLIDFNNQGVFSALARTPANREERSLAINSYIPAQVNLVRTVSQQDAGDKFYSLQWNGQKKAYEAKWNGKMLNVDRELPIGPGDAMVLPAGATGTVKPTPSKNIQLQVKALNTSVHILSQLSAQGWDPTVSKNVPDAERRAFYGIGRPTSEMKAEKDKGTAPSIDSMEKLLQEGLKNLSTAPSYKTGDITGPGRKAVATALSTALPAPVVAGFMGNLEVEAGYHGAKGDGGSAAGIAQWRDERRTNFKTVVGKPIEEASHEEQAKFILWEMNNPEKAGMTVEQRDAILNAKTPEEAAELIDKFYERSSGEHRQARIAAATAFGGGN
jgi:hypothetical protein